MKGIELPINVIVIVSIAVLVLLVIGGFFTSSTGSGIVQIQNLNAKAEACSQLVSQYNCDENRLSSAFANIGGNRMTLTQICETMGITDNTECANSCGCFNGVHNPVAGNIPVVPAGSDDTGGSEGESGGSTTGGNEFNPFIGVRDPTTGTPGGLPVEIS